MTLGLLRRREKGQLGTVQGMVMEGWGRVREACLVVGILD